MTIQKMLETEMDEHLGYRDYERSDNPDSRNKKKRRRYAADSERRRLKMKIGSEL